MFIIIFHSVRCMRLSGTGDAIDAQTYPLTTEDLTEAIGDDRRVAPRSGSYGRSARRSNRLVAVGPARGQSVW